MAENQRHLVDTTLRGYNHDAVMGVLSANPWMDDIKLAFAHGNASGKFGDDGTMAWDTGSALFSFVEFDPAGSPLVPKVGMSVQAQSTDDDTWYNATITDTSEALSTGMLTIRWSVDDDVLLSEAEWFRTEGGGGPVDRRVATVRRCLRITDERRWGMVVRVADGPPRSLDVQVLLPLDASAHHEYEGDLRFPGMRLEPLQYTLTKTIVSVIDTDVFVLNAGKTLMSFETSKRTALAKTQHHCVSDYSATHSKAY
jgi:hypothetical protein